MTSLLCGLYLPCFSLTITRVEPPNWWIGMEAVELQLMVYGTDLTGDITARALHTGVKVKRVELADNPNHLFVYLTINKRTRPGTFNIEIAARGQTSRFAYQLLRRDTVNAPKAGISTDDVVYSVMCDRFSNGTNRNDQFRDAGDKIDRANMNARHGGDISGLTKKIGYLSSLGVTTIALSPMTESQIPTGSYRGDAPTHFYKVDSRLGTEQEFLSFVQTAHQTQLKVMLDVVISSCGSRHPWMSVVPGADWVLGRGIQITSTKHQYAVMDTYATKYDNMVLERGVTNRNQTRLNQRNPKVLQYMTQNVIWWIEMFGLDAVRIPSLPYNDYSFISNLSRGIMLEYPNFNIIGDTPYLKEASCAWWQRGSSINNRELKGNLKTVSDYPLYNASQRAFIDNSNESLTSLYEVISQDFLYPNPENTLVFLDNLASKRFSDQNTVFRNFKQAMTFLCTSRGIPQITYGSEILLNSKRPNETAYACFDFPGGWSSDKKNAFSASGRNAKENQAFNYLKQLLLWRKDSEAVKRGVFKHFPVVNGIYAYARYTSKETVIIILNGTNSTKIFDTAVLSELPGMSTSAFDVFTKRSYDITQPINMVPRESLILQTQTRP
ncbi:MAG: alpha-amylase family glycosyl hydrolase [Bacteroidales bacterium]